MEVFLTVLALLLWSSFVFMFGYFTACLCHTSKLADEALQLYEYNSADGNAEA